MIGLALLLNNRIIEINSRIIEKELKFTKKL
jgi:hypothetical protein